MAEVIGKPKLLQEFEGIIRYRQPQILVHTSGEAAENIRQPTPRMEKALL
jgi:hypothetical protein